MSPDKLKHQGSINYKDIEVTTENSRKNIVSSECHSEYDHYVKFNSFENSQESFNNNNY